MDVYAQAKRTIYTLVICCYTVVSFVLISIDVLKGFLVICSWFVVLFLFIVIFENKIRKLKSFKKLGNEHNIYIYICY